MTEHFLDELVEMTGLRGKVRIDPCTVRGIETLSDSVLIRISGLEGGPLTIVEVRDSYDEVCAILGIKS